LHLLVRKNVRCMGLLFQKIEAIWRNDRYICILNF